MQKAEGDLKHVIHKKDKLKAEQEHLHDTHEKLQKSLEQTEERLQRSTMESKAISHETENVRRAYVKVMVYGYEVLLKICSWPMKEEYGYQSVQLVQ